MESEMDNDRRGAIIGTLAVVGLAGAATSGCSLFQGGSTNWVTNLLTNLGTIQAQVRQQLVGFCTTATSMVPSIDGALEALKAALNVTSIGPETTIGLTAIETAVNGIIAIGCPTPGPAPAPTAVPGQAAPPVAVGPSKGTINGKPVTVTWV
jgi:hypothetical protein